MLGRRYKPDVRNSLLQRYCSQLGMIVERNRAEMALFAAKNEAEMAADKARKAMLEAQAADRAKTEFLANMSHELRTPLNAIIGFSEMMTLLGNEAKSKFLEYARDISASGHHLLELINDILDLAKIEAGKLELDEQNIDVEKVIDACLTIIKERAQERNLELSYHVSRDLPLLCADERKLKQILINLLSNAVKFTPAGGKVTLKAFVDQDQSFVFSIEDTGIGIAESDINKALAPFEQVDSTLERKFEGTGLGLPLTKALIELHDGSIAINSRVGEGTRVLVRFPQARVCALAA